MIFSVGDNFGIVGSIVEPFFPPPVMSRTYFSAEVKCQAIDLVLRDRLTVATAAQQVGCSINALHGWIKKYHQEQHPVPPSPPTFVPITLADPKSSSIEIITPNGFTVRLNTPISLGELLAAIASC
jgi:transposase-like protein